MGRPVTVTESVEQITSVDVAVAVKAYSRARVYKNLVTLGVMMLLSYSSTSPTITLVTSIAGKTLGNITFCLNFVFSCLFNLVSMSLLSNGMSKRKAMIIGNSCLIGFAACNWYVSYYTLIPGTVLFGFGVSILWIGSMMYTSKTAVHYAKRYNLTEQSVASYFTGLVVGLISIGYLLGSATTAGVLTLSKFNDYENYYNHTDSSLSIDNNFTNFHEECHTNDDKLEFNFITVNMLRGMIMFYSLLALVVTVLFLDDIDGEAHVAITMLEMLSNYLKYQWQDVASMTKLFIKKEMTLSCLRCFAVGVGISFMFTRFTKTYVAECVGVHVVGYAIMVYGIGGTLGSFISGKLLALKTEWLIALGTLFFHLIIIIFLVIWDREPIMLLLLFISLAWGTCDGSWMTIFNSFAATYFGEEKTRYSFAVQLIVFQFGMGCGALLSLLTPIGVNLIIVGAMFLITVPLHQIVIYCSKPCVHKAYEMPAFFVEEYV